MGTFAPLLADSLEGFNKSFLSFLVNKGFQASGHTQEGIKGKKGINVVRARTAQKGVTTFRTLIPFIPALCVPEGIGQQSCSPSHPCAMRGGGPRFHGSFPAHPYTGRSDRGFSVFLRLHKGVVLWMAMVDDRRSCMGVHQMILAPLGLARTTKGCSRETIDTWQQLGFPVAMRGGSGVRSEYESEACIHWLVERELSKVQPETLSNCVALAKAQAVEMDNAERRKQLIRVDRLEPRLKAAFVAARGMWQDEPARLAREAEDKTPQEAEDMLAVAFDAFLVRLSQWPHVPESDPAE